MNCQISVGSVKHGLWSVKYYIEVWAVGVWSVKYTLRSIKCEGRTETVIWYLWRVKENIEGLQLKLGDLFMCFLQTVLNIVRFTCKAKSPFALAYSLENCQED